MNISTLVKRILACAVVVFMGCAVVLAGPQSGASDSEGSLAALTAEVRLLRLSRTFGKEIALTAGLDHTRYDAVIVMDADGQQPLTTLTVFVHHWRAGYDMVYGVRNDRRGESIWKRWFTRSILAT
jgi:glycosyltransferase involved in cell wall biosynthesis